jgi:CDP-diacylglycerol--glycerol-3-phosphate 3-phosphatidyltransferase
VSAADALATLRAVLTIPIAFAVLAERRDVALVLFVIAALTDAADGYLARRWGRLGPRGDFLDPIADKILIIGTLLALTLAGTGWPVTVVTILVTLREGLVTILRARALARGIGMPADMIAKAKTVIEMVGVALIIIDGRPWAVFGTGLIGVAFLIGIATLPRYFSARVT